MMEEADLLKERLQAITDKRRIQEDIARKRREIEEEKLKFQYIKKKALREQWLMDGLSQQSEEEQEAMRLQAQDEQQQSDQLQSNIQRIEKEIEALEAQELNISANEEVLLRRLKEVERTAQDIIKELNAEFRTDVVDHAPSPLPDISAVTQLTPAPLCHSDNEEPKKAVFTMEISVEHDHKTGRSQVVSTATITPDSIHERGLKVYDDGRKSVYALKPMGEKMPVEAVGEMTSREVEELLRQATDKNVPSEVQYHQPVYSALYTGTSRPSTPRTPEKLQRQMVTPSPSQSISAANRGQSQLCQEQEGLKTQRKSSSPNFTQVDSMSSAYKHGEETKPSYCDIPGQSKSDERFIPQPCSPSSGAKSITNKMNESSQATLVSVKSRSEGMSEAIVRLYRAKDANRSSPSSHKSEVDPDALRENSISLNSVASLNLINNLPSELQSEPITMIFMGYEKADDEDEEDFQAELVIINSDDDDEDEDDTSTVTDRNMEECLSYHPEGFKSKVFQPKVALAKVTDGRDMSEDADFGLNDLELHKPTFMHKPGKHGASLQGMDEAASKGNINMEEMKLYSTAR